MTQPRVPPLPASEWNEETVDAIAAMMPRSAAEAAARDGTTVPNVLGMLARHPALAKSFFIWSRYVLFNSSLSDRIRELLILRIAWLRRAEYEWGQHVVAGERAGISRTEIEAVAEGPEAAAWEPFEAALIRAVDELHADAFISNATWEELSARLDQRQLMDLVFTVGTYDLIAMAFNTFQLELDPGLEGWGKLSPA